MVIRTRNYNWKSRIKLDLVTVWIFSDFQMVIVGLVFRCLGVLRPGVVQVGLGVEVLNLGRVLAREVGAGTGDVGLR